jgi:hypothetical protein
MVKVELAEPSNWSTAIKGSWGGASAGVRLRDHIETSDVEEGVKSDHVRRHGVRPFEDLGAYVDKKGIGRPASEDHDLGGAVVHEEERHGGARTYRAVSDLVRVKAKGLVAAVKRAGVAQE